MTRKRRAGPALQAIYNEVQTSLSADGETAAAITCALPAIRFYSAMLDESWPWLERVEDDWFRQTLSRLREYSSGLSPTLEQSLREVDLTDHRVMLWDLYELFLKCTGAQERRELGAFYTPPAIARYLVHQADFHLREHLGIVHGLFDRELPGKILEPACGSGVFLSAALKRCRSHPDWNQQTAGDVVQRLVGIDVSRVAIFLCRLRFAVLLRSSGIELDGSFPQLALWRGNALAGPDQIPPISDHVSVVLGNPPFSYLSQNDQPWIQSLIRGDKQNAGYFEIDGEALDEKKTWLHDDYVKFLRLAQWCIEQNGSGVVSLVTNHGWLDNATFRIARQQLLRTFNQIDVVDLHGNAKRHEASPTGDRDANVFGIAQGIALVTLTKSHRTTHSKVSRADLWGSREKKLARLSHAEVEPLPSQTIVPAPPWYTFAEQSPELPPEYQSAPLLTEIMPVTSTVPVTARDYFVVAASREELEQRLAEFCDAKIPDDEIRRKYFQRTRSNRYESGDTRGWKLPAARRRLMSEANPISSIRRCLYRPFVWRFILWHPSLIDWPRTEFTRHFDRGDNLALLTRRQSIAGREANFFWITNCLPLDGVIRSDNRGSESFFPLWLTSEARPIANFAPDWLREHDPRTALAYLYTLFHSPTYRKRYAAGLAMEFPRVLQPAEEALFDALATLGEQLIELHLTDPHDNAAAIPPSALSLSHSAIASFHVGTYNVCRKWLQMERESPDTAAFQRLQGLIGRTIELQREIDERIEAAGGFTTAFR